MLEQNIKFQEEYKRLDNLCKDCYDTQEGVSYYIGEMERNWSQGVRYVFAWEDTYYELKRVRWIRNQLAHEIGTFDSDIVEEYDLHFVVELCDKILNREDPLAKIYSANNKFNKVSIATNKTDFINQEISKEDQGEKGFLSKLFDKIKRLFK